MKRIIISVTYSLIIALLFVSCFSESNNSGRRVYPEEMIISPNIQKEFENYDPDFFCNMNTEELKLYSLGDYYILQSVLCGPMGRGSNFFYYLLVDKNFSKDMFFMSLSNERKNFWLLRNTLFVDLWDYDEEAYWNNEYYFCDSCDFMLIHTRQSPYAFSLDTLNKETVRTTLKDIKSYYGDGAIDRL